MFSHTENGAYSKAKGLYPLRFWIAWETPGNSCSIIYSSFYNIS